MFAPMIVRVQSKYRRWELSIDIRNKWPIKTQAAIGFAGLSNIRGKHTML